MTEHIDTFKKLLVAWIGMVYGYVTLDRVAIMLTIIYTSVNLYLLIRDKVIRDRGQHYETDHR